jgi:hypothetical protein
MTRKTLTWMACGLVAATAAWLTARSEEPSHKLTTVSTRKLADSVHAVLAAEQQVYAERIAPQSGTPAHAEMLRTVAQKIQTGGAEFSFTLRSLTPINPNNGPQTEAEQAGLERVAAHPEENFYTEEQLGGRSYFTAVYAERAALNSCVACHNQHPHSPRHDFKPGDVMGAIVVRVPLEF